MVKEYFAWEGDFKHVGKPFNQGKVFKWEDDEAVELRHSGLPLCNTLKQRTLGHMCLLCCKNYFEWCLKTSEFCLGGPQTGFLKFDLRNKEFPSMLIRGIYFCCVTCLNVFINFERWAFLSWYVINNAAWIPRQSCNLLKLATRIFGECSGTSDGTLNYFLIDMRE